MASPVCRDVPLPLPSGIAWSWGPNFTGHRVPQPVMGYYWTMPDDAACVLSAAQTPRSFEPGRVPTGRNANWDDEKVRAVIATLRNARGPRMEALVRPIIWEDMYRYFDAVDLRSMGAWNLWRVLHFACDENDGPIAQPSLDDDHGQEVENWAYEWLTNEQNRNRLALWDQRSDILSIFPPSDTRDIVECDLAALNVLRGTLKQWYNYYHNPSPQLDDQMNTTGSITNLDDVRDSLPDRAHDDNDINLESPPSSSIAQLGHRRRRSNSISLPSDDEPQDNSCFVYSRTQSVTVMDGSGPSTIQQSAHASASSEATVRPPSKRHHQHSKSGPIPALALGQSLATRGAGVEAAGPSRLPSVSYQVPEPIDNTPQQFNQEPQQHNHEPTVSISTNGNGVSSHSSPDAFQARGRTRNRQTLHHSGDCLNRHVTIQNPPEAFAPCSCQRCVQKSRSVHVGPLRLGKASQRQAMTAVTDFLSEWGFVEECDLKRSMKGTYYAFGRYTSEDSTHLAVRESGSLILSHPLLHGSKVSYPFFSKFYRYRSQSRAESEANAQTPGNWNPPSWGTGDAFMADGSPYNRGAGPSQQSPPQPGNSQPRFGGRPRTHNQRRQAASTAINATPVRNQHQRMPAQTPAANGGTRTQSMMQPGPAHEHSASFNGYSESSSYVQQPWNGSYPQGGSPFQQEAHPMQMHYGPPQEGFHSPNFQYSWPHMPVPVDQWGFQYPSSPTHMDYHGSFNLQQQPEPSGFAVPIQHTMPYSPANEGTQPPVLYVPAVPASISNDADVPTQPGNPSGSASMQTKPPSENEAFEDLVTPIEGSANHSAQSSFGSIAIRVRIPETPASRSEISVNSPVRRVTFGDMPPNSEHKEPEEPADTRDQSVVIPDGNRVSDGSPVRRITFGDMALEAEQKEPEKPSVIIPDHNRVESDSPVRSVTFGDLGPSNSPTPGPSEPTAPIPAPVPTLAPAPVVQRLIEGNRIPTLSDDWDRPGFSTGRIHHGPFQQSNNMHRNASQASTVADMPQDDLAGMPFLRQLEEMSRIRTRNNQEQTQSQRNQGDVRLDPDFSGTVIRHRPRKHGHFKSWMAASNPYTDNQAPPYPEDHSPYQPLPVSEPLEAPGPSRFRANENPEEPQPHVHSNTYQQLPVSEPLEAPGPSKAKSKNNKKRKNKQSKNRTNLDSSQPSTRSTTPLSQPNLALPARPPTPATWTLTPNTTTNPTPNPTDTRPHTPPPPSASGDDSGKRYPGQVDDDDLYNATPPRRERNGTTADTRPHTPAIPSSSSADTRPHTPPPLPPPSGDSSGDGKRYPGQVDDDNLYDATPPPKPKVKRDGKGKGKEKEKAVSDASGVGVGAEQERDHASGDGQT